MKAMVSNRAIARSDSDLLEVVLEQLREIVRIGVVAAAQVERVLWPAAVPDLGYLNQQLIVDRRWLALCPRHYAALRSGRARHAVSARIRPVDHGLFERQEGVADASTPARRRLIARPPGRLPRLTALSSLKLDLARAGVEVEIATASSRRLANASSAAAVERARM